MNVNERGATAYDDFRAPVIAALCAALGLPFADVAEVEPGRYSPRVRIDLNPAVAGNGLITYGVGEGGWVAVRGSEVERLGLDAASWDPPMRADDQTVRDALAAAHRDLLSAERCENQPMNYPQYPTGKPWRVGINRDPQEVRLIVADGDTHLTVEDIDQLTAALGAGRGVLTGWAEPEAGDSAPDDTMHPAIRDALRGFECAHLPDDLRAVSMPFRDLAYTLAELLPNDPETTRGLHKLVESKDCAVRAVVFNRETA